MEPNTGPAQCRAHERLECCSPHHPWGSYFLVFFFGLTLIYLVAGTVYGVQHGKEGIDALPNAVFWRDVSEPVDICGVTSSLRYAFLPV